MEKLSSSGATGNRVSDALRLFAQLFGRSGKTIFTAPLRWKAGGWSIFAAVIISTLFAFIEKRPIQRLFMGNDGKTADFLSEIARIFGDGDTVVVLIFILFLIGFILKKKVAVETGVALAVAGIWCGIFTVAGQFIFAEARPDEGGAMAFFQLKGHGVSGHASSVALLFWPIFSILGQRLSKGGRILLAALLLGWAGMVSWSRMWDNLHYLWNIILGLSIGFSMGYAVVLEWQQLRKSHSS
jgi:membrane-associated phospholipid phosphatase